MSQKIFIYTLSNGGKFVVRCYTRNAATRLMREHCKLFGLKPTRLQMSPNVNLYMDHVDAYSAN